MQLLSTTRKSSRCASRLIRKHRVTGPAERYTKRGREDGDDRVSDRRRDPGTNVLPIPLSDRRKPDGYKARPRVAGPTVARVLRARVFRIPVTGPGRFPADHPPERTVVPARVPPTWFRRSERARSPASSVSTISVHTMQLLSRYPVLYGFGFYLRTFGIKIGFTKSTVFIFLL